MRFEEERSKEREKKAEENKVAKKKRMRNEKKKGIEEILNINIDSRQSNFYSSHHI